MTAQEINTTKNIPKPSNRESEIQSSKNQKQSVLKKPQGITYKNLEQVFGKCINCKVVEKEIAKKDAIELEQLPVMVKKTIKEIIKHKKGRYEDYHKIVTRLSKGTINNNCNSALRTGERTCQVFYFSFINNSVELMGTHRCRVEKINGDLSIFKFTGNRLFTILKPYRKSALVYIGRSYLSEHRQKKYDRENPDNIENDNFGNEVG